MPVVICVLWYCACGKDHQARDSTIIENNAPAVCFCVAVAIVYSCSV